MLEMAWKNVIKYSEPDIQVLEEALELFVDKDGQWNDESLEEAIEALWSYSLVEITGKGDILLEMHALVHVWSFKSITKEEQIKAKICGQQLFYYLNKEDRSYNDIVQWVFHVQALVKLLAQDAIDVKAADAMGHIFKKAHLWNEAIPLQRQVLKIYMGAHGDNHPDTIKPWIILLQHCGLLKSFKQKNLDS
ncbi:hypothetical protein C0992_010026, partial [Termitomyces sp. T32_za158]